MGNNSQSSKDIKHSRLCIHLETSERVSNILWKKFQAQHPNKRTFYTLSQRLGFAYTALLNFHQLYHSPHHSQPSKYSQELLVRRILSFHDDGKWYIIRQLSA